MKKSIKPFIALCLFIFVVLAFLTLAYVGVKLECEKMIREKVIAEQKLDDLKNSSINLTAQNQALSSEERIVTIAQNELDMVKQTEPPVLMTVSKEKINKISEAINKNHD